MMDEVIGKYGKNNGKYIETIDTTHADLKRLQELFTETSKIKDVMTTCTLFPTNQLVSFLLLRHMSLIL